MKNLLIVLVFVSLSSFAFSDSKFDTFINDIDDGSEYFFDYSTDFFIEGPLKDSCKIVEPAAAVEFLNNEYTTWGYPIDEKVRSEGLAVFANMLGAGKYWECRDAYYSFCELGQRSYISVAKGGFRIQFKMFIDDDCY